MLSILVNEIDDGLTVAVQGDLMPHNLCKMVAEEMPRITIELLKYMLDNTKEDRNKAKKVIVTQFFLSFIRYLKMTDLYEDEKTDETQAKDYIMNMIKNEILKNK